MSQPAAAVETQLPEPEPVIALRPEDVDSDDLCTSSSSSEPEDESSDDEEVPGMDVKEEEPEVKKAKRPKKA